MAAYHVALRKLAAGIEAKGLVPRERAIFLVAERPEAMEGFDIWEVDVDIPADGDTTMWSRPVPPSMVRLAAPETAPSPGM